MLETKNEMILRFLAYAQVAGK